ncbi:DnaJ-like protein xdj1 [Oleoguttula sp. CCFEE 5521]
MSAGEEDLYEVLSITRGATKAEIKKAYHKAALSSHPDKVPDDERAEADVKFKSISQAYEILSDDQTRHLYDEHGMAAFDKSSGPGGPPGGVDLDDILAQMFAGGGMGGMGGMPSGGFPGMPGGMPGGGPARGRKRPKGKPELQQYEVSLEELYKGKTTKFTSTKNVVCTNCSGRGGREKAKPKQCDTCKGRGVQMRMRPVGPGLVTQEQVPCTTCAGRGEFYAEKDKCKRCKGVRTIKEKKILELYIPRGSREGERIVLPNEADQDPDDEQPGDIIFELVEEPHDVFHRAGADLQAEIEVDLTESLTGVNRTVLKHLDGRGISLNTTADGRVLRPNEVLKISGEGMPIKRSDAKGDLYLVVNVRFPKDGWLWLQKPDAAAKVKAALPAEEVEPVEPTPESVDEVDFQTVDNLDGFGKGSDDPRAAGEWEDEDDDDEGGQAAQCAQQ